MSIYEEIQAERARQDEKWGGTEHDDEEPMMAWTDYITRYASWAGMNALMGGIKGRANYRRRMMQVAALAVAACEAYDRLWGRPDEGSKG